MIEKHYSPEQLEQLRERAEQLGPEGLEQAERAWAELAAAVEREWEAGTDPADPRVQALVSRWEALIEQFTDGDPGIRGSLERTYRDEGAESASRGVVKPELMEYLARAKAARPEDAG